MTNHIDELIFDLDPLFNDTTKCAPINKTDAMFFGCREELIKKRMCNLCIHKKNNGDFVILAMQFANITKDKRKEAIKFLKAVRTCYCNTKYINSSKTDDAIKHIQAYIKIYKESRYVRY